MTASKNFSTGQLTARTFGVHQVDLRGPAGLENPFLLAAQVTFTSPSGNPVTVDAFFDGGRTWRARVYVTEAGSWRWQVQAPQGVSISPAEGQFEAVESGLPGRLLPHPQAPTHWVREDGRPFLHFNDTAYHLFRASEPQWREYARDAAAQGITSLRVASLGGPAWDASGQVPLGEGVTYPWLGADTTRFDLAAFQVSDERLAWLLDHYPDLYLQVILFGLIEWGKDSTGHAWLSIPQQDRERTVRYMLARWAAFPQVFWLVVNDIHCSDDFPQNLAFVREVGRWVAALDPWQHPLSAGPRRRMAFPFHPQNDPWVSYVHIEDHFDLNAEKIRLYAGWGVPVFLGEDRYENDRPAYDPLHPDFFFRCLFLNWLLAGGAASYGGRWRALTPYGQSGSVPYDTGWNTTNDIVYTQRLRGLDSLPHLRAFFDQRGIELWRFQADDDRARSVEPASTAYPPRLARRGWHELIVYHPNADGQEREVNANFDRVPVITIDLSPSSSAYLAEWFRPSTGESLEGGVFLGGAPAELAAPWPGDVLLRLLATC